KEIFILLTTTILERGVTFPSVDVAVLDAGHDVFDEAALVQIAGRAGRSPDDPDGEVVFFHDGKTESIVDAVRSIKTMDKRARSEEHTSELQSRFDLVCRLLLEKKKLHTCCKPMPCLYMDRYYH